MILAGIVQAAVAARGATKTVPIVCPMLADPVRLGLIRSDARPEGNVTGIRLEVEGLPGKQLELVLDLIPRATKIGLVVNPDNASSLTQRRELEIAVAAKASAKLTAAFQEGMRAHGYIEGRDFEREYGWAEGHLERLSGLAEQMVRSRIDVILAGIVQAAVAARGATKTVPIVCPMLADPVRLGLIKSDARPEGNVTGIRLEVEGLPGKQLELVLDLIPRATKIGLVVNPDNASSLTQRRELEIAVAAKAIKIVSIEARSPEEVDPIFPTFANERVDAVVVLQDAMFYRERGRLVASAVGLAFPPTLLVRADEVIE